MNLYLLLCFCLYFFHSGMKHVFPQRIYGFTVYISFLFGLDMWFDRQNLSLFTL